MKSFIKFGAIIAVAMSMVACSRAPSNVHVITTDDCGAKWEKISTGGSVPKHAGNPCGYNLALPNWPMAGEADFKTQFKGGVLTRSRLSYTYAITDPLKFIGNAAYLGKMGGSLEISAENVGSRYEMAENIIIDKALREITTEITRDEEIVDANPAEIEDMIFKKIADLLAQKGVVISDLALVLEPDDQTRLAIDVATAMRVYENAGIKDAGKQIAVARAGATKVTVTNEVTKSEK